MKNKIIPAILFLIVLSMPLLSNAQRVRNAATNGFEPMPTFTNSINPVNVDRSSGPSCGANSFWACGYDSVLEYQITGDSVTLVGGYAKGTAFSLAYCNNLNGGSFSPTFYSSYQNTQYMYNNGTWDSIGSSEYQLINAGGYGDYLYYQGGIVSQTSIIRYQNAAFNVIFQDSGIFTSAAIAVDSTGNVWFEGGYSFDTMTYIEAISPSGQILKHYPVDTFISGNAYGAFFMGDTLYIGFGSNNPTYPNKLIGYTFSQDIATIVDTINMPGVTFLSDLSSCSPGAPLGGPSGISRVNTSPKFNIYPDPAIDQITITIDENLPNRNATISDISGRIVSSVYLKNAKTIVDVSDYADGIYFVSVPNANGDKMIRKLIVAR
jgi:hypothetical protein